MDEERQNDLFATRLLIASQPGGKAMARTASGEAAVIGRLEAKKLLGRIDTVNSGMGAFTLMVPAAAIREAGLETTWQSFFTPVPHKGAPHYPVQDYMLSVNLLSRLEVVAEARYADARALYEQAQAGKGGTVQR